MDFVTTGTPVTYDAQWSGKSERGGDEQAVFCKLAKELYLRLNSCWDKEFPRLADILFLHGFLLSRAAF